VAICLYIKKILITTESFIGWAAERALQAGRTRRKSGCFAFCSRPWLRTQNRHMPPSVKPSSAASQSQNQCSGCVSIFRAFAFPRLTTVCDITTASRLSVCGIGSFKARTIRETVSTEIGISSCDTRTTLVWMAKAPPSPGRSPQKPSKADPGPNSEFFKPDQTATTTTICLVVVSKCTEPFLKDAVITNNMLGLVQ